MVRRAYRGAFSEDELEDIYSTAWVGTLRALERRHRELSDEEIRRYLLAAVANSASKEIRRRRRKPTEPLDLADRVPDEGVARPEEHVLDAERSRITRDLLVSLPKRRRAVMLLRYGWGLEPSQVCELIDGLSPRAYRKEVTRGVEQLTERMRRLERGEWCGDRESLLESYAAGLADADERRQAEAHMSHCAQCSDFVARLGGHLNEVGGAVSIPAAFDALHAEHPLTDRIGEAVERGRDAVGGLIARGSGESALEGAGQIAAAGGARGAGATAGAGLLAKLGGLGTAGKIAVACLSGGAAATACVGVGMVSGLGASEAETKLPRSAPREAGAAPRAFDGRRTIDAPVVVPEAPQEQPGGDGGPPRSADPEPAPAPAPSPEPADPVAPSAPPVQQEFGVAAAAAPSGGSAGATGGSGGGGSNGSAVRREFGP